MLSSLIQHLYDNHGKISPMDIEESGHAVKEEWYLLDPIVDFLNK